MIKMYRKTYARINHNILTDNIKEIKKKYPEYDYYFGVVKNNAYHHGIKVVNALKAGGINYFAVSSLEEALELRKYELNTPVLILEPIEIDYIYDCINNNITITIENLKDIQNLLSLKVSYQLKIHLKLDTGMNRLGFKDKKELEQAIQLLKNSENLYLEGIYTHFATSGINDYYWDEQIKRFKDLTENIDLEQIPIIHLGRSQTLVNHPKIDMCNGIRLGIVMYGFPQNIKKDNTLKGKIRELKNNIFRKKHHISKTILSNDLKLKTAFSLHSKIISIRPITKDEFVGYNASFISKEKACVATVPIGYADGIDKKFKYVSINQQRYPIIADTMDMIMILVDNNIRVGMEVEIFGSDITIPEVTKNIDVNAYHLFNLIQNRVPRIHQVNDEEEEIKY